ncbi:MAG: hypothetical protein H0W39_00995 [Sphingomonas sp.]|nr:hypothetical protein [Sphingomonas sp.]
MGIEKTRRFCPEDNRMVLAERQTPNHLLHLVLSVLTLGLWLIVWLAQAIYPRPYLCPMCGGKTKRRGLFD